MNSNVQDQQYIDELAVMMKRQRALTALNVAMSIKNVNPSAKLDDIRKILDVSQQGLLNAARFNYGATPAELCKVRPLIAVDLLNGITSIPLKYFVATGKLAAAFEAAVARINGAMIRTPIYGYIDHNGHHILAASGCGNSKGDAKLRLRGSVDISTIDGFKEITLSELPMDRIEILIRN